MLVWPELLFHALRELHARYADQSELWVQTNGDLLDEATLERLLSHHVSRIDVSGMDQFHLKSTLQRRDYLSRLFESFEMQFTDTVADANVDDKFDSQRPVAQYAFWGATEDKWIGPLWPRGRAQRKQLSQAGPSDRFCGMWSGAKNFLNYLEPGCEVNVQLSDVYPCCPMTCRPLGDLQHEPLIAMLDRCREHPAYRALNEGRPEAVGEFAGISEAFGTRRSKELGNHCLWCDEFFTKYAPDLLAHGCKTERGAVDLVQLSSTY